MRLLLVEDDRMIGHSVQRGLRQEGYAVDWVLDGQSAELALDATGYELVLLDIGLPRKDGLSVLQHLRHQNNPVPVLMLTARDAIADRIKGLDTGADDYLVKPFDLDELSARIRALLRRRVGRTESLIDLGHLHINTATHQVWLDGVLIPLSAREFALLQGLAEQPGKPLSRIQLEEKLYGWGEEIESNAIEVHIHNLRRKLGPEWIKNLRGVGWMVPKQL
ncbi:MAG TPA: response regulator [Rhodocyclaceae bacterium]|nr:response regulator [Rhodocyclaceae bacterium]